jgi:hypothetical protein
MTDIDRKLMDAGRRWRDSQAAPPPIKVESLEQRPARVRRPWPLVAALSLVAIAAIMIAASQLRAVAPGVGAASPPAVCVPTKPSRPFVPPAGYLSVPPNSPQFAWFGSADLWTILNADGETWSGSPAARDNVAIPQKTFWWSSRWSPDAEPMPAITVSGQRLDGDGSFSYGPGTNASADFGTAMLVGIDVPGPGCWRLTATYRDSSLSYTVLVTAAPNASSVASALETSMSAATCSSSQSVLTEASTTERASSQARSGSNQNRPRTDGLCASTCACDVTGGS